MYSGEDVVRVRERQYMVLIEIAYAGGRLSADTCKALVSAMQAAVGEETAPLSFGVSSDPYAILSLSATVRATSSLAAVSRLDSALDGSLMSTGLFEEFDVTGKVLRVAPREMADRVQGMPESAP